MTRPTSLSEADLASTTDILVEAFWPGMSPLCPKPGASALVPCLGPEVDMQTNSVDVAMQAMAAFDKGVLGYMMRKRLEAALTINAALIYRASPVRRQATL